MSRAAGQVLRTEGTGRAGAWRCEQGTGWRPVWWALGNTLQAEGEEAARERAYESLGAKESDGTLRSMERVVKGRGDSFSSTCFRSHS